MVPSNQVQVNEFGHLTMAGHDVTKLAATYQTPLYLMDEDKIRENCRMYTEALERCYGGNGMILYASKALSCKYMCRIMKEENMGLDVVSGGELYTALAAGFPVDKIYFHGNNKTEDELVFAIENRVGRIVTDNMRELSMISEIAGRLQKTVSVSFRIKPGVEAHTHEFIRTGQIDSKFGFALETGEAMDAIKFAHALENVNPVGVHCHIGSQIFDLKPFEEAAAIMMNFMADVRDSLGLTLTELNLGGGYGIRYLPQDRPVPYGDYIEAVAGCLRSVCEERGMELPYVLMEPGRSIVAEAGITVYTVGAVKDIPNVRKYVAVDGGMGDNPRYILYQAEYDAVLANRADAEKTEVVTIAGKCCESGDLLIKDIKMPDIQPGDLLAVLATGGYNYSMASNYNRIPRPPVVMVSRSGVREAVRRETYEDLLRNDL